MVLRSGDFSYHYQKSLDMKLPKPTVDLAEIARMYHAAVEEEGARTKRIPGRKLTRQKNSQGDAINMGAVYVD
jgi:hypothetical protein